MLSKQGPGFFVSMEFMFEIEDGYRARSVPFTVVNSGMLILNGSEQVLRVIDVDAEGTAMTLERGNDV